MLDADERQVVQKALDKDLAALEKLLFLRYEWLIAESRKKIPRDLLGIVEPEDVVQDACIKIFEHFESFQPASEASLFQWMRRITQNVAVDHLRKLSRRPGDFGKAAEPGFDMLLDELELMDLTASTVLRKKELIRAFSIAMEKLEPNYRQTIELLYLGSKTLSEVAEQLGKSEAAVRGYRQRAKEKLRESILRLSLYV